MGNKNIFTRGDFDQFKISDEELQELMNKEIPDDDFFKAYGTKYKSKKLVNGKWRYTYADGREESVNWHEKNANKQELRQFIQDSINNKNYDERIKIADLPSHFSDKLKLKLGYRYTKLVTDSCAIRHSIQAKHHLNTEDILLLQKVIQNKHTIIRSVGLSRKQKKEIYNFTGYSNGIIHFIIACDRKNNEIVLFDCYREVEKSVKLSCNCPRANVLDGSQPIITLSYNTEMSITNYNKSLTYSGHKLQGRTRYAGMNISIENKKGSYRCGTDKDGHKWRTFMNFDYGYIRGTEGVDGDHVDCYIGPDKTAQQVYVIHQNDPVTKKYDEDKCMLCFSSAEDAKKAYLMQYDRPGFYGSMETLGLEQFKSYVFSHLGSRIHKSFTVEISDITENNKAAKVEQLEKALNATYTHKPFYINHIPVDGSTRYNNVVMRITDFSKEKINKSVRTLSFSLDTPLKAVKGEVFMYKAQEDLTNKHIQQITDATKEVYTFLINYLGLPEMRIVQKAELVHKGKILYNPQDGKPITQEEWKRFVAALENFLNRKYNGVGNRIVLDAQTLGRILDRMLETNSLETVKELRLDGLKYKGKSFDWISNSVKSMTDIFGDSLSREQQARIQIMQASAAQKITKVTDTMRNDIQQILIDGVKNKETKQKVSQNLFDKCVGLNRDFQRIADTEIQSATNDAYIQEEVYKTPEGQKTYFKRFEILDDNTCKKCAAMRGKIVLWSDYPLESSSIKDDYADYAIWEGSQVENGDVPTGVYHPYCRGSWYRYFPETIDKQ